MVYKKEAQKVTSKIKINNINKRLDGIYWLLYNEATITNMSSLLKKNKKEILKHILLPFCYSRLLLLIIAWFSQYFSAANQSQQFAFSNLRFLDVWGRWDSGWYLKIAQQGYLLSNQGNNWNGFAFFPLYPSLIKLFSLLVPQQFLTPEIWLFIAVCLANLFFIFGLIVFYFLVKNIFLDQQKYHDQAKKIAQKSLIFLLFFPTSFFFSCAYTESLFFLLTVVSFSLIKNKKYFFASLIISCASLSRPYGITLLLPLAISYLQSKKWQLSKINWQCSYLLLPVLTLAIYCWYCYLQSGDFLAFLHAQDTFGKQLSWPWQSIFQSKNFIGYISPLDKVMAIVGSLLLLYAFKLLPIHLTIWANVVNFIPLMSGTIGSNTRYLSLLLPIFVVLAIISQKKPQLEIALLALSLVLQVLLFSAWCQFYWVA